MTALIITVALALSVSALCSMLEAMLYSLSWTALEKMREDGSKTGGLLYTLRANVDQPISAILTTNTIANTAGASIAGALAASTLGDASTPAFAALFTVLVLLFGEIVPKTLGVSYPEQLGRLLAWPLYVLTALLRPMTWLSGMVTRLITPKASGPEATEDDIKAMARISRQAGTIQGYEETTISNVLALDQKHVHDIMTPRTVVFSLPEDYTVEQAFNNPTFWHFSRVPVYAGDNEDVVGLVLRRDVAMQRDTEHGHKTLAEIMRPIHFVLESLTLDKLLTEFLERHQHLFAVLDEFGGLAGVVSLEDVMEEMLGREIVDESDMVTDMREAARERRARAVANGSSAPEAAENQ
ncbi:hemolysin family protein [uncultured Mailhella sp.]|uniref:hemolysin family protein n=1 Tax=uncultured Mailhella sp. TaxID=1981031 RepID=UPI00260DBDC2|nr:hemolysin family protein [uncultured Mailhella sp.]